MTDQYAGQEVAGQKRYRMKMDYITVQRAVCIFKKNVKNTRLSAAIK